MAYTISTALAIYFVLWWVTLFLTLPFGVRSQHEEGLQADLDHGDLRHHFRHRHVGLPGRISFHRAPLEIDGDAVLDF
jgi:hypothetical protein